jgi:mannose-6-phosphate isomerase-like protein (cupin superfamily)
MSDQQASGTIRNVVEALWEDLPGHFGGAYSKMLVRPEVCGSRRIDYRISTYQPKGYVEAHAHRVQEQVYHILEGEALMELGAERRVVRRHDVIFVPPGVRHAIYNTGLSDLTFIVVTSPPDDLEPGPEPG